LNAGAALAVATYTGDGNGNYSVDVSDDGSFDPPASTNYRIVISATRDGAAFGWWEEDVEVFVNS
jgi:hypothetical protein